MNPEQAPKASREQAPASLESHYEESKESREKLFSRRALLLWSLPAAAAGFAVLVPRDTSAVDYTDHDDHYDNYLDSYYDTHADYHEDIPHGDNDPHYDTYENWHNDAWHNDGGVETHTDLHGDNYGPGVYCDLGGYGDRAHIDTYDDYYDMHNDGEYCDSEYWYVHNDVAHADWPHQDTPYTDTLHTDEHQDLHNDWGHDDHTDNYADYVDHQDYSDHQDSYEDYTDAQQDHTDSHTDYTDHQDYSDS
jgi:hypothetical protein